MSRKTEIFTIFKRSVEEVKPKAVIQKNLSIKKDIIIVAKEKYNLKKYKNLYIFGAGKASIDMAKEAERILGKKIKGGFVVGTKQRKLKHIDTFVSTHPIPTLKSLKAGKELKKRMKGLGKKDLFLFFLSGGASALIEDLKKPLSLKDLKETTKILLKSGADIDDMNVIRKAISNIKGGALAEGIKAEGSVVVFSDVMGDSLETIGSAPMSAKNYPSSSKVEKIKKEYNLQYNLPKSVLKVIKTMKKPQGKKFSHQIVVNNKKALKAAGRVAKKMGFHTYQMPIHLEGEAKDMAVKLANCAKNIQYNSEYKLPACLIVGGETTVTLQGDGKGGRNQEFVLAFLQEIKNRKGISVFSGGTDGIDGNCSSAGAYGDCDIFEKSQELGLDIDDYLARNDSNSFFKQTHSLLNTGYTGTNVTDVAIIVVDKELDNG